MTNGVPNWEEWKTLTDEQRQYELHRTLKTMDARFNHCPEQLAMCDKRFKKVESPIKEAGRQAWIGAVTFLGAIMGSWLMLRWYLPDKIEAALPGIVREIMKGGDF
jgi:hypothetical protein